MKTEIYLPREDSYFLTQILEEQVTELLNQNSNLTFLEIGSGSGIQLETLLKISIKKQNIFSCDINPHAVRHCKKLGFNCVRSDLFKNIKGKYDIIIFNPPYLPKESLESKSSRVSTTGGEKGNEIINEFLKQAKRYLNKNGRIFLLTSSLSGRINFLDYKKEIIAKKKLFFEELYIWKLEITTKE
jgi:release factor glutamine methyltransferase|tara:strand:+ start:18083 stop:18640 length:558 start_codon:yes stop_codon:yes gene_type:complete